MLVDTKKVFININKLSSELNDDDTITIDDLKEKGLIYISVLVFQCAFFSILFENE